MEQEWKLLTTIVPDIFETVKDRYDILRHLYWMQPIGRRTLAEKIGVTERSLRTDIEVLRTKDLIVVTKSGMSLTASGLATYRGLERLMDSLSGTAKIQRQIKEHFGIKECIVVAGNSDSEKKVYEEFGKIVSQLLDRTLSRKNNVIAVMGGTTMATIANHLEPLEKGRHNIFVPARGGVGETVNIQANSVSSVMAQKTGGHYRALYVPEQVSREVYQPLLKEPVIQDVLQLIEKSDAVIFGIGKALHMAARRKMSANVLSMLKEQKAVAEYFGYFFDEAGNVVYKIPRIGLQLKNLNHISVVVAVAGGKSKGKAVTAYLKNAPKQTRLVTDMACATEVLKGITL